MEVSTKLFISIIVVIFLFIIGCEVTYNKLLHEDFIETHNQLMKSEERFNKLWEIHLEVINKGGN